MTQLTSKINLLLLDFCSLARLFLVCQGRGGGKAESQCGLGVRASDCDLRDPGSNSCAAMEVFWVNLAQSLSQPNLPHWVMRAGGQISKWEGLKKRIWGLLGAEEDGIVWERWYKGNGDLHESLQVPCLFIFLYSITEEAILYGHLVHNAEINQICHQASQLTLFLLLPPGLAMYLWGSHSPVLGTQPTA